jgi:integrase
MAAQVVHQAEEQTVGIITSDYGFVRIFTRHVKKCREYFKESSPPGSIQGNDCKFRCPIWISDSKCGRLDPRYPLKARTWDAAIREAKYILKGYDPDVARGREIKETREKSRTSVDDAVDLWLVEQKRLHPPKKNRSYERYETTANRIKRWALAHKRITSIGDITTADLRTWYGSEEWTEQPANTQAGDWLKIRMLFKWLHAERVISENPILVIKPNKPGRGRQGPYTPTQLAIIFGHVEITPIPRKTSPEEKLVYRERLTKFMTTLLRVGTDVVDAVLFQPGEIQDEFTSDGVLQAVYTYKRKKEKEDDPTEAVVPLDADYAAELRSIPITSANPPGMPFRTPGLTLEEDAIMWSKRVKEHLVHAGVTEVAVGGLDRDGKPRTNPSNAKQFRHTFCIHQLAGGKEGGRGDGLPPKAVAVMMGHHNTRMIELTYGKWCKQLKQALIDEVHRKRNSQ